MHTGLTLIGLISARCFLLARCTCPWEDGSVCAVGLVFDEYELGLLVFEALGNQ